MVEMARTGLVRAQALYDLQVGICRFNGRNPGDDFQAKLNYCTLREARGRLDALVTVHRLG
jgi:hypothetical protein